jgi:hypothetical protein
VESLVYLVQVVRSSLSPFLEVVSEKVVTPVEFVRVPFGFVKFLSIWSMDVSPVVNVDVVNPLRRSEPQVIVAWSSSLSEATDGHVGQSCRLVSDSPH